MQAGPRPQEAAAAESVFATNYRSGEPLSVRVIQFSVGRAAAPANVTCVVLQPMTG